MNKNKLIPSLLLSALCLMGASMSHATNDKWRLAERCSIVAHDLRTLIPEQKNQYCKGSLKQSALEMDLSKHLIIMKDGKSAIPFLEEAADLLSDQRMNLCAKSETIFKLSHEIKGIMFEAIHNH